MKRHNTITLTLLMVALLLAAIAGCSDPHANKNITVKTVTAKNQELKTSLNLAGVLLPAQTADISSRITGQVQSVGPDVGSPVKTDDILVVLDTEMLNGQLMQAQAGLKAAGAAAKLAQSAMDSSRTRIWKTWKIAPSKSVMKSTSSSPDSEIPMATSNSRSHRLYSRKTGLRPKSSRKTKRFTKPTF